MREILFRAQRVDNNEWIQGYYFIDLENKKPYIHLSERKNTPEDWMVKSLEVIPETVGQFIGTDKKWNKVFEGMKTIEGGTILWNKEKNLYAVHKKYHNTSEFVIQSYPMFLSEIEIDINS